MVDAGARNTIKQSVKNCLVPRKITVGAQITAARSRYRFIFHPSIPLFKQILLLNRQHPGYLSPPTWLARKQGGGKRDRGSVRDKLWFKHARANYSRD